MTIWKRANYNGYMETCYLQWKSLINIIQFRGDHIVPNFEEIWPSQRDKDAKYKRNAIGK